ncbi:MAG: hypothetical protein U0Q12_15665 [Vicinamibacterales bacterium]
MFRLGLAAAAVWLSVGLTTGAGAAPQRRPAPKPAPRTAKPVPPPALKSEPAQVQCPNPLGVGATSKRTFCDVLTTRDPAEGIQIPVPPHVGEATVTFDLHNRQTYSEQLVKQGRAYARYTATLSARTPDNAPLAALVVQSEFRSERDLVDRILGGAGPGGLKAVAPTGVELVSVTVPQQVTMLCVLGEQLVVETLDGREQFVTPGRPIAIISNVNLEYRPAPAPAPRRRP